MTDYSKLKVLVTGGAGFIGSNLVEHLMKNKVGLVRVLDNFSTGYRKNIQEFEGSSNFELVEGDIRNQNDCNTSCQGIDYVLHHAALGSVPRSINDPATTNEVNITGFLNMLVAVKDEGVKRMVYAASSSTYGDSQGSPKIEDKIGKPLSPYAVTKYVNEVYADVFARTYSTETIGLRYFNIFGPKQDPNGAYAAVIPKFINLVLEKKVPTINGDGTISRDFTFIDNVVQANMQAMLIDDNRAVNQVYNIACGDSTSLNELYQYIKELAQVDQVPIYGPGRKGDIPFSLANIDKATTLLGYSPEVKFKQGLKQTFEWFKENKAI